MMPISDEMIDILSESFRTMSNQEFDEIMEEMIRDGVMDRDGKVLVAGQVPDGPPDWAKPANGHATIAAPKKPKRRRKTT